MDFDENASLAFRPPEAIARYLQAIGDEDAAALVLREGARPQGLAATLGLRYLGSGHQFGYIGQTGGEIVAATSITADKDLVGTTIKVTLDKFHVHEYPGLGRHRILLDVTGRNQAGTEREDLRFTTVVEANDGDSAGVSGIPVFTGLSVPADGLAFQALTVLIGSNTDDIVVDALKSPTFQSGLKLLANVQPILPQLVQLAAGVTGSILKRLLNAQVQAFQLGLDFNDTPTSCSLRHGSYVVVQATDDGSWAWVDWVFDHDRQLLVSKADSKVAPFNFLIFGVAVSHSSEPAAAAAAVSAAPKPSSRLAKKAKK